MSATASASRPCVGVMTASHPGAVGIVQLHGAGACDLAERVCGVRPTRRVRLARFEDIDEGLIASLGDDWCQLMPHGGVRVMQRLVERLAELGATPTHEDVPAGVLYPEADAPVEADMLAALSRCPSPAAIDRLLAQPVLWRELVASGTAVDATKPHAIDRHTRALDRLMQPPRIVVAGAPNVGKSTLTNHLAGRAASIVADLPGTTRDWVGTLIELPTPAGDVAVQWLDTPGLHLSDDPIEQRAIELAARVIDNADLLIAMRDDACDWPTLPRPADLRVVNKTDRPAAAALLRDAPGAIGLAARDGRGIELLANAIADRLGLTGVPPDAAWAFSDTLKQSLATPIDLSPYLFPQAR